MKKKHFQNEKNVRELSIIKHSGSHPIHQDSKILKHLNKII